MTGHERLQQLKDEITVLQSRLDDMGLDGDCAYERAISRLYTSLVADRKKQLAMLQQTAAC